MPRPTITIRSRFDPSKTEDALKSVIGVESWISVPDPCGEHFLLGNVKDGRIRIRRSFSYAGRFARVFYGRIVSEGEEARIEGYFAIPRPERYIKWFLVALPICLAAAISGGLAAEMTVTKQLTAMETSVWFLVLFGLLTIAWLQRRFSRWSGARDEHYILERMEDAISDHSHRRELGAEAESLVN